METDSSVSKAQWLLDRAQKAENTFEARSWLLTARNTHPTLFSVQYAAYELECKAKTSPPDAAAILLTLVKNEEFENEKVLWDEIEAVINSDSEPENSFRRKILAVYTKSGKQHRELIINCAEKQTDINKNVELMVRLVTQYNEQIGSIGPQMTENLLNEEKKRDYPTALNECRQILVTQVLPVITNSNVQAIAAKNYYKWFQKAIEFTTVYCVENQNSNLLDGFVIKDPWAKLKKLRTTIGAKCNWIEEKSHSSLLDNVRWVTALSSQRRSSSQEQALRKQTFYTLGHLHLESAVRYMTMVEPQLVLANDSVLPTIFPIHNMLENLGGKQTEKGWFPDDAVEMFKAATESYQILMPKDKPTDFSKDWGHLERRWKVEHWNWHRLYIIDRNIHEKDYVQAVTILTNMLKQPNLSTRVICRCQAQLGTCYYALKKIKSAVRPLVESIMLLKEDPNILTKRQSYGNVQWVRAESNDLLPSVVQALLAGLEEIINGMTKEKQIRIIGWMLILTQYEWPRFSQKMRIATEKIQKEKSFEYLGLLKYIGESATLEELAWLHNQDIPLKLTEEELDRTQFRELLIKTVQTADDPTNCILAFLRESKDEVVSLIDRYIKR